MIVTRITPAQIFPTPKISTLTKLPKTWFSLAPVFHTFLLTCCRVNDESKSPKTWFSLAPVFHTFLLAAEWIMSPMMEAAVMADHFDSINKLPEGVAGVPNWRCVPGYQVPQGNDEADGGWWMCPKGRMHTTEWHLESHVQPTLESSPGLAIGSFHSISA